MILSSTCLSIHLRMQLLPMSPAPPPPPLYLIPLPSQSSLADRATCSRVVARICGLVRTQRRLQGFQMRQAMLPFNLGMGVLAAVHSSSGQTLTRLGLEDFFGDQIPFKLPAMPDRFTKMVKLLCVSVCIYVFLCVSLCVYLCGGGRGVD